jgi:hypothetical protein
MRLKKEENRPFRNLSEAEALKYPVPGVFGSLEFDAVPRSCSDSGPIVLFHLALNLNTLSKISQRFYAGGK